MVNYSELYDKLMSNDYELITEEERRLIEEFKEQELEGQEKEIYQELVEGQDDIFYIEELFDDLFEQYHVMAKVWLRIFKKKKIDDPFMNEYRDLFYAIQANNGKTLNKEQRQFVRGLLSKELTEEEKELYNDFMTRTVDYDFMEMGGVFETRSDHYKVLAILWCMAEEETKKNS